MSEERKGRKKPPRTGSLPTPPINPAGLGEIGFCEAGVRLESVVQHVIELQRRRAELGRMRRTS